jgi:hypothetical protein
MPYIGDMGPHDEGHCFKCNQAVKFVSVDEREVDEWKKQFDQPVRHCLTYVGRFAPGKFCPKCGKQLTVNEKAYNTIDPERPHYERRLTCPGFFTTGCRHREAFTIEVQNLIDAEAAARENAPAEF